MVTMLGEGTFTQSDFLKNLWTAAKSATIRPEPWPIREGRSQINRLAACDLLPSLTGLRFAAALETAVLSMRGNR